jgi:hypothetical protein
VLPLRTIWISAPSRRGLANHLVGCKPGLLKIASDHTLGYSFITTSDEARDGMKTSIEGSGWRS